MKQKILLLLGLALCYISGMAQAEDVFSEGQVKYTVLSAKDRMASATWLENAPVDPLRHQRFLSRHYCLSFEANHPDYVLYIKDADGEVAYTTTVYSVMTLVTLPSTLSGDYEIEFVCDGWIFTGSISL